MGYRVMWQYITVRVSLVVVPLERRIAQAAVPPVTEVVMNDEDYGANSYFQLEPISEDVLARVVQNLRGGSAPGEDGIPATLIKIFHFYIL
ncbi:hypothetical protein J6590_028150 [Homalodisca vitripennis]|nr:hypothetical protein J6590_028150 [Homalodisca vitripennis]